AAGSGAARPELAEAARTPRAKMPPGGGRRGRRELVIRIVDAEPGALRQGRPLPDVSSGGATPGGELSEPSTVRRAEGRASWHRTRRWPTVRTGGAPPVPGSITGHKGHFMNAFHRPRRCTVAHHFVVTLK